MNPSILLALALTSTGARSVDDVMQTICTLPVTPDTSCFGPPNTCTQLENELFITGACYRYRLKLKSENYLECQKDLAISETLSGSSLMELGATSEGISTWTLVAAIVGSVAVGAAVGAIAGVTLSAH